MSNYNLFDDDDDLFKNSFLDNLDSSALNGTEIYEKSNNKLNVSALCCDEEINGYDKLMGRTWIYPTNYPVRDYQFNIIKATILQNTLVSLPTGLGKTFIAAVIMYNYYRWYPTGKIIFTAPTRPLVAQQIEACYNVCAIPPEDTIEMTGHMQVNTRKLHWTSKRVFFATPQVVYNDIKSGICPADRIRCLVFDEAHKARGNYAYCQIISTLDDLGHKTYRVLALSATPGSKVDDVCNVVKNLKIAHLEMRTENCIDVNPYKHNRSIKTVVIELGAELSQLRDKYLKIVDGYARRLQEMSILPSNIGNLSKGRLVMLYKEYQNKDRVSRHPQHNYIMKDFVLLISLFHGLELLVKHGARVFLNFFDEHTEKTWMQEDDQITALLEMLRDDLGVNPMSLNTSILPDGSIPEIPKDLQFGHPKFYKLKEIMMEHFTKAKEKGQETKAIVFCEYRESVNLVHCLLLQCRPLIVPQTFVGQGATGKDGRTVVSQKQQLRVMRSFRSGACNVLVATCVAEEGLDVGSVDLCLCFDISTRSPIRLVQRCGRTGRERGGQVYILVTEGREHQTLQDCMRQKDAITKKVLHSKEIENTLYKSNPRMMPRDHMPQCQKMHITVQKKPEPVEKSKSIDKPTKSKGQKDIRSMLLDRQATSSSSFGSIDGRSSLITKEQFERLYPDGYLEKSYFKEKEEYISLSKESLNYNENKEINKNNDLSKWLEWQRKLQTTVNIGHSSDSGVLSDVLQLCDKKRFDKPVLSQFFHQPSQALCTQSVQIKSPIKQKETKKKQKLAQSPGKRDGDIRALFSGIKSTKNYTKVVHDLGLQNYQNIPTKLLDLLVELNINNPDEENTTCESCDTLMSKETKNIINNAKNSKPKRSLTFLTNPVYPDLNLLTEIDSKIIEKLMSEKKHNTEISMDDECIVNNNSNQIKVNYDIHNEIITNNDLDVSVENSQSMCTNFDIGNIEDIFDENSPKHTGNVENTAKETLNFLGLHSIDDIFAISDDDSIQSSESVVIQNKENIKDSINVKPIPISPSVLSGVCNRNLFSNSPILMSQKQNSSTPMRSKTVKNLSKSYFEEPKLSSGTNIPNNSKSMLSHSEILAMIAGEKSVSNYDNSVEICCNDRSGSPVFLTQNVKRNLMSNSSSTSKTEERSIVIESSDEDSDDTIDYNIREEISKIHEIFKSQRNSIQSVLKSPKEDSLIVESSFFKRTPSPISPFKNKSSVYKQKKKKRRTNGFLDLEAKLDNSLGQSGDELTDDSMGSVRDFICDDDKLTQPDMHAVYLQSVRSPVKGTFKIPKVLPRITENIFSQAVIEDKDNEYEFDSFTVDSHIGLTQVQDLSELEIAERKLKALRREKKKAKNVNNKRRIEPLHRYDSDDSFICTTKTKKRKHRIIDSDSDDS